ncbi:arsenic resistance protein [Streptomyces spiramenti]|uniref:Arsenic resistance protein n=1 Tax=Streptomyces spiramenti TaxID=2720606 RepID=A0ABX1AQU8_9ACTN|nr:bile acid:sodium symporter [Streptomyces spiramenti]NJP67425.1 arsenic resistance protein [Streptomyces spiramenti]
MEHHQVAVYVAAIAVGLLCGLAVPAAGPALEVGITPVLVALLYATFLQVPASRLLASLRAGRFLVAVLVVDFVLVPLVVAAAFPLLPADDAVRLGFLLVMLSPCIDYVIAFTRLAGGSDRRLLAATPLLLVVQMLLLPVFLLLFLGDGLADVVETRPFVEAFVVFIVVPLALAWATQAWSARRRAGAVVTERVEAAMVPLMAATLLLVVGSQVPQLDGGLGEVAVLVPFFVGFLVVMPLLAAVVARLLRLEPADGRALAFTGATRNGLVLLPLALALPDAFAVAAVVMVLQTLVEVTGMVVYVRVIPRLFPGR